MLGTLNLGEILSQRESIANEMKAVLDVATAPWGVMVERVEVILIVIVAHDHNLDHLPHNDQMSMMKIR